MSDNDDDDKNDALDNSNLTVLFHFNISFTRSRAVETRFQ